MKRLLVLSTVLMLLLSACSPWEINIGDFHMSGGQPAATQAPVVSPTTIPAGNGGNTTGNTTGNSSLTAPEPTSRYRLYDYVIFGGVPAKAEAYRWANGRYHENLCTLPWGKDMCGTPGVLETHDPNDRNPSAIFISPDTQERLENETSHLPIPMDGYMRWTTGYGFVRFGDQSVTLRQNAETDYHLYVRGTNAPGPGDYNLEAYFSLYNPGFSTVTTYDVPVGSNGFMDQESIEKAVANSHKNNCGDGCLVVVVVFLDTNNGAWTAMAHTEAFGWQFMGSNVVPPADAH